MSDAEQPRPEIDRTPVAEENDVVYPRLDRAQMETLRAAGRTVPLKTGEVLYAPGELDYDLIVVVSGCVEIIDAIDTQHERVLVSYGARQFAGELNLITLEPTLLSARVAQEGEAIFVSREALRGVISRDTRLGDLITNALVSRRAIIIEAESGARLIGHGGDPGTRELREFLTRNRVPHRFIDLDGSELATSLTDGRPLADDALPMLVSGDKVLRAPTILEAATALHPRGPNKTAKKTRGT